MNTRISTLAGAVAGLTLAGATEAGSHLWRISEVFSSADGTVQFIEMEECCGATDEIFIGDKYVQSDATGNQYVFPEDLPAGSTANAHLLLATAGFAALPGAPEPDHIIPDNFFDLSADTIRYWLYNAALLGPCVP